jgi:tetratricopeptide (TPR) repeat protein
MKNIIFLNATVLFCLSAYSQTSDQLYNESLKSFNDKDFYHALKSVEKSIEADSGNGKAYYLRGLIYFNTNQFKQAVPDFDKTIELNIP